MKIRPNKGLTFDDVLLVPKRSAIASRQDVDTSTWLTPTIRLRVPIVRYRSAYGNRYGPGRRYWHHSSFYDR